MLRRPPVVTLTAPLFPDTTRFRSAELRAAFHRREKRRAAPNRGAAFGPQTHAAAGCTLLQLAKNRVRAGKAARARAARAADLLHRPLQPGLNRRRPCVEIGSLEAQPRLQPPAVARAKEIGRAHV